MTSFNEAVKARAAQVAELVISKQRDYGPNNIMRNHVRPELALAVRLSDKIARVVNLAEKGTDPSNEALQDTWMDIVGYGLIGLMVLNSEFELPLEGGDGGFLPVAPPFPEPAPTAVIKANQKLDPEAVNRMRNVLALMKRQGLI